MAVEDLPSETETVDISVKLLKRKFLKLNVGQKQVIASSLLWSISVSQ